METDTENRPSRAFRPNLPRTIPDKPGVQPYIASVCIAYAVHTRNHQRGDDWVEDGLYRFSSIFIQLWLCMALKSFFVALVRCWAGSKD